MSTMNGLDGETKPEMYVPFTQIPSTERRPTIVVRTAIDPAAVTAGLRNAVSEIDSALPLDQVETMEQLVSASVGQPRFRTILLAAFSVLALLIASVGIYGVMNYLVSQRIGNSAFVSRSARRKATSFGLCSAGRRY